MQAAAGYRRRKPRQRTAKLPTVKRRRGTRNERRRARGERVAADPRLRFADAQTAWWESRASKMRPATQSAYAASLKHLRDYFGHRRMTDVTPGEVAAYVSAKRAEGLKGWTIKGHLTVLSSVFT